MFKRYFPGFRDGLRSRLVNWWWQTVLMVLQLLSALPAYYLAYKFRQPAWVLVFIPLYFLTQFAEVLIHETGHATFGRIVGFRLGYYMAGPLQLDRTTNGWQWRWRWSRLLNFGGYVHSTPPSISAQPRQLGWYAAGGIIFNFLSLPFIAVLLLLISPGVGWATLSVQGIAVVALASLFLGSLSSVITNSLPIMMQGQALDGKVIWETLRPGRVATRWVALFGLGRPLVRPRDWPQEWLAAATALPDNSSPHWWAVHSLYFYWLDRGDEAQALPYLEAVYQNRTVLSPKLQPAIALELAFHLLYFRRDIEAARLVLQKVKRGDKKLPTRSLALAAWLWCDGQVAQAEQAARRGLKAARYEHQTGQMLMKQEWLLQLSRCSQPAVPDVTMSGV